MAATSVATRPAGLPLQRIRLDVATILCTLLLATVAFVVLYPIVLLAINSFNVAPFGRAATWGLDNWQTALSQPRIVNALKNTVSLAVVRQAIAVVVGIGIAWVLARTNVPGRGWLEMCFWFALLLPVLPILLGWIILLDGHHGLLVTAVRQVFPGFGFDIFSWWGIIAAHLMINLIPLKVFLLTPAFRNMDSSLEEASRASGASTLRTVVRIVIPLMAPTILFVTLLGLIRSMQSFEIELILGGAAKIDVYSTLIYRQVLQSPPQYGTATALSMVVLVGLIPFILLQQHLVARRNFTTVSGKYTNRLYDLGPLKWPTFALIAGLLVFIIVVPVILMILGTFMKVFGVFDLPTGIWTLNNWQRVLADPKLTRGLLNTLTIAGGSMIFSITLFTIIAYVSVRTRYVGRRILDFITWIPSTVPGIVTSLGLLWLFIGTPFFRPLYGTTWVLIIALGFAGLTLGVQLIKASMMQLGAELEEASWASGAGRIYTLRRVVLPLIAPTMAVVALQNFGAAASAVSLVALLGSSNNKPLSLMQLEYMDTGSFEPATVLGVIIFMLTVSAAILARLVSMRWGLGRFDRSR
ncbi:MAG: iron(III) transport system permease protein [Chloroflexota bacterium]|jgi:iron(III) transport system permease protein|nr:iron(III) transport system permease protein [Chloroflexota bacterium]